MKRLRCSVRWGIPYQGSKSKHVSKIFNAISQRDTGNRRILDPFMGGFAVSHYFLTRGWEVESSDLDSLTVALVTGALRGDLQGYDSRWVPREEFIEARDRPEASGKANFELGYIRQCWSFGNTGTSYLYGEHLEEVKFLIHNLIVFGIPSKRLEFLTGVPEKYQEDISELPSIDSRRIGWARFAKHYSRRYRGSQLASIIQQDHLTRANRVINLSKVSNANVKSRGYEEALESAGEGDVVYCDPPYADTEGYLVGGFDHEKFWENVSECARRGAQVYVSEYTAPKGWRSILSFDRPNVLAASSEAKSSVRYVEHLFVKDKS